MLHRRERCGSPSRSCSCVAVIQPQLPADVRDGSGSVRSIPFFAYGFLVWSRWTLPTRSWAMAVSYWVANAMPRCDHAYSQHRDPTRRDVHALSHIAFVAAGCADRRVRGADPAPGPAASRSPRQSPGSCRRAIVRRNHRGSGSAGNHPTDQHLVVLRRSPYSSACTWSNVIAFTAVPRWQGDLDHARRDVAANLLAGYPRTVRPRQRHRLGRLYRPQHRIPGALLRCPESSPRTSPS